MTPPLRPAWYYAPLDMYAETLEELDERVERYVESAQKVNEKRVRAVLARKAGKQRKDYLKARAALEADRRRK